MNSNPENRDKTRFDHESPIILENIDIGKLRTARMYNFSDFGLYFEADVRLEPDTELRIGIPNSPFASQPDKHEKYRGIIRWRKPLKKSSFYYGYGVEFLEDVREDRADKPGSDSRKHPRKKCSIPLKYESKRLLYRGMVENISRGGIFIKSKSDVEVGQRIRVAIPLKKNGKFAKMTGKVTWHNQTGFGVKFTRTD
jgi:Tfp pilus assembly protein PilZ